MEDHEIQEILTELRMHPEVKLKITVYTKDDMAQISDALNREFPYGYPRTFAIELSTFGGQGALLEEM